MADVVERNMLHINWQMVYCLILVHCIFFCGCAPLTRPPNEPSTIPSKYLGHFIDDYKIEYEISSEQFILLPNDRFHILEWNQEESYLIVCNDSSNTYAPGRFGRIDIMDFSGMDPYVWGFCTIAYEEITAQKAESNRSADRDHPKNGCNGFPFTRMKIVGNKK